MSTYCVYKTSFLPLRISQSVVKSKNVGNYNKKKKDSNCYTDYCTKHYRHKGGTIFICSVWKQGEDYKIHLARGDSWAGFQRTQTILVGRKEGIPWDRNSINNYIIFERNEWIGVTKHRIWYRKRWELL